MPKLTDYSKYSGNNKLPNRKMPYFLVFIMLCIIIFFSFVLFIIPQYFKPSAKPQNTIKNDLVKKNVEILNKDENSQIIAKLIEPEINNADGKYAIAIKNLKTGERYFLNEHKIFETASLYKLFVMATVFQKIEKGELSEEDILSQKIEVLNKKFRIASESAELTEGEITLPVKSALTRMVTVSDNYSALLLTEKVRLSQVQLFLKNYNFTDSKVGTAGENPSTSAYDMLQFFDRLYNTQLSGKNYTLAMIGLLKHQQVNTKLPLYLPEDSEISHKTGELGTLSHDAGIVYTKNGDYVIVVLTDTKNVLAANDNIAKISKKVFEYFNKDI